MTNSLEPSQKSSRVPLHPQHVHDHQHMICDMRARDQKKAVEIQKGTHAPLRLIIAGSFLEDSNLQ
ncbi:Hypothetical protein SMAX5B_017844 [Scophthalmus maximus]|uniref:Uncharacterized protein n=1 Tax=Scophthalmus maximus TaxID=52904 RepID=A0A2U9BX80_SCOMX|nr:Hypothetical protein SMAX5B_017844 [Scophthalmus maximus]